MTLSGPVFLAGPLADPVVLAALGADPQAPSAVLPGFALVQGGPAGLPLWAEGEGVTGRLAPMAPDEARALAAALGGELAPVPLADGQAVEAVMGEVLGASIPATRPEAWDADEWSARYAAGFAAALPELLSAGAGAHPRLAMILSQAEGRVRAAAAPREDRAAGGSAGEVSVLSRSVGYSGFFSYEVLDLEYPGLGGGEQQSVRREVLRGTEAAMLLPYDPAADAVLLVEQFRPGAYRRGDPWPWTFEPVAGLVDAGETPAEAAVREAAEEAGIAIDQLIPAGAGYPSPGITSEFFHLFVGLADLGAPAGGGLAEEGEDIRVHVLSWDEFDAFLDGPGARVLPLVTLGQWLRLNRADLRQSGG